MMIFSRIAYEFRWWKWALFTNPIPKASTLILNRMMPDEETRDILYKRWAQTEPAYNGVYIKRAGKPALVTVDTLLIYLSKTLNDWRQCHVHTAEGNRLH